LICTLHSDALDPNFPVVSARSVAELEAHKSCSEGVFVRGRYRAALAYAQEASEERREWYSAKMKPLEYLNAIYTSPSPEQVAKFLERSTQHMQQIREFILRSLPSYLPELGFVEGDTPGEADFHLAAWLARIALVCGSASTCMGKEMLEKELGEALPEKVGRYWDAWTDRESWKRVYRDGLH
jgi:hypothetical protein